MQKILCTTLLASFFVCCGPQRHPTAQNYFSYPSEHLKINSTELVPFEQIKAPNEAIQKKIDLQDVIAETARNWSIGNYEFPRPYPYLVSAAPFYCDPLRYPPSLVMGMYACQPYIPQIMEIGFYHSSRPGF